ncbi:MAG: hypothetical protein KJ732_08105 [Candidatus Margulisbacteria bacterium]|nr:hypothetical protein [Candidatus Margulisiibacteriota bacterium]
MKFLSIALLVILIAAPSLARPFSYNLAYGPEYFSFSSKKGNTQSSLVTCGIVCSGNIFKRLNAEVRGGVGEISTTKINYNEISLLYKTADDPDSSLGIGPSYLTYNNILDKATNVNFEIHQLNARIKWARSFSPIWGMYLNVVGPNILSYDLGWLAYWGDDYGDFNVRLGYKELKFNGEDSMRGPYIASSIYF